MIKLFKQIRQQLLTQNRFNKYVLYAIGEIVLVVIGILIALSINNWNEDRKSQNLERTYLLGILDDLKTDTTAINSRVIPNFLNNHRVAHQYLDSLDRNNLLTNDSLLAEVIAPSRMSFSGLSFHPTVGTYNAIISQGNSRLLRNVELYNAIQRLYEIWYKRNNEYSARRDKLMDDIKSKYAYQFKYLTIKEQVQNKELLADLYHMLQRKREYVGLLRDIEKEIVSIVLQIQDQLDQ